MGIPLCDRTALPFTVSIHVTAEDSSPSTLHCELDSEQIAVAEPVPFSVTVPAASSSTSANQTKLHQPSSPVAKELLELILAHNVPEQRGLTEILESSPSSPLEACFIPNTTARGKAPSVKKSLLRAAIAELVQLGWLLPPESDGRVQIYELNPEAT
jgi:hypothetical protein